MLGQAQANEGSREGRRRRRRAAAFAPRVVALVVALTPGRAHAESPLSEAAKALAHDLGPATPGARLVVASPLTSDLPATRGDELAARVAELVAGALGDGARAEPHPASASIARARAHGAALVYVDVRVEAGELRLTGDLYPVVKNSWDRLRGGVAPPTAHAYVHAALGAEVRAYLAPVHLERAGVTKWKHDGGTLLALACGDLDGDGGNDLVLVSDREVSWGHLKDGRFIAARKAPATTLGTRSPVPWREPLATAWTVPGEGRGTLFVGWTGRSGASMGPELLPEAHLVGLPVAVGRGIACVVPDAAHAAFGDALVGCVDGRPLPGGSASASQAAEVDAWVAVDIVGREGQATRVVAARDAGGTLRLSRPAAGGTTDVASMPDVGAQLALADLDEDGLVETVTTLPRARGEEDALVVSSWTAEGLAPRLRWPTPVGVDAVAVCPASGNEAGVPTIVAAVGQELWLVR